MKILMRSQNDFLCTRITKVFSSTNLMNGYRKDGKREGIRNSQYFLCVYTINNILDFFYSKYSRKKKKKKKKKCRPSPFFFFFAALKPL